MILFIKNKIFLQIFAFICIDISIFVKNDNNPNAYTNVKVRINLTNFSKADVFCLAFIIN